MQKQEISEMNIHEKILRIADMAGVLRKTKQGYGYHYTPEDEIQAKITAGMQKYGVNLMPSLVPGSLEVIPYNYQKAKTKKVKNEKTNKEESVDYTVPVSEIIVKAEVEYIWVNVHRPEEKVVCHWAYIGQMDDASQAFGAGATYGNRYYLLKALQLATTEADPDEYRSKQKAAESYEEDKAEKEAAVKNVKSLATQNSWQKLKRSLLILQKLIRSLFIRGCFLHRQKPIPRKTAPEWIILQQMVTTVFR